MFLEFIYVYKFEFVGSSLIVYTVMKLFLVEIGNVWPYDTDSIRLNYIKNAFKLSYVAVL